ncbi:hypothetical protein [Parachryseolinea silvisoli]|jgi:hypothetical protein|uniref:hypothetical protein n=1 Tax=Parachryseolinea silvisoli TaxID=2873601 RepID=UPI002265E3D6|nr:hypothetical protein [Parachryseolinea silvisoli]MCD9018472.1 hypothetical protein [Parachryseolinea silvisoli]
MKTGRFTGTLPFVLVICMLSIGCQKDHGHPPKPSGLISLKRAREMYQAYQPRFDAVTKFRDGNEDARYGWHSLDYYKEYIAYLEDESKKIGVEVSGLRLYYVAYPEDAESGDQRGYQTFIYLPTYYDKKQDKHIAFDPLYLDDAGKPIPVHDLITKGESKEAMFLKAGLLMSVAPGSVGNMGEMCKPNCSE